MTYMFDCKIAEIAAKGSNNILIGYTFTVTQS